MENTLLARVLAQGGTQEERATIRAIFSNMTEEQTEQLLALDGFTEEYKIPVWGNEMGETARERHTTPPERYVDAQTAPRDVAADLFVLFLAAKRFNNVPEQIDALQQLSTTNKDYWARIKAIFPEIPRVGGRRLNKITLTTDMLNKDFIWTQDQWTDEQRAEGIAKMLILDRNNSPQETHTKLIIDFSGLEGMKPTKELDPQDEAIYTAAANLYQAGNEYISLNMLYSVDHDTPPGEKEKAALDEHITKMERTFFAIDNTEEAENTKYKKFSYSASLLPIERVSCYINGKLVEQAIHFLREPPAFTYAKLRKQLTTVDSRLLHIPMRSTKKTLRLHFYLLRTIAAAKNNPNLSRRVRFDTVFDMLGISNPSEKSRYKRYMQDLLDFYRKENFITRYEFDRAGVTYFFPGKTLGNV